MAEVRVEQLGASDLGQVVHLHRRAFVDGAITALGDEAVERYYAWLVEGPHDAVLSGAWLDDRLVGFCAAGVFRGAMSGFLRRNRAYLARHILRHPHLLLSSIVRDRIRAALSITMKFSRVRPKPATQVAAPPSFGVLAIATDETIRGTGAGRALMLDAEKRARAMGHSRMVLTVHPDNTRAVRFYEGLGWTRYEAGPTWAGVMEKLLDLV